MTWQPQEPIKQASCDLATARPITVSRCDLVVMPWLCDTATCATIQLVSVVWALAGSHLSLHLFHLSVEVKESITIAHLFKLRPVLWMKLIVCHFLRQYVLMVGYNSANLSVFEAFNMFWRFSPIKWPDMQTAQICGMILKKTCPVGSNRVF